MIVPIEKEYALASIKRRFVAFIIDYFVMSFLMFSIAMLALVSNSMDDNSMSNRTAVMLSVMSVGFLFYFAKDSIKGISVGKWIMGIMVRDSRNPNETPSLGRLFVRNLFIIIWPVEFIVLATNQNKRRLGDQTAKTIVVQNPNKPTRTPRVLTLVGVGITFFTLLLLLVGSFMKNSEAYKLAIKEIETNKEIIAETGGITGYGMMPSGSINTTNGNGQAQLNIKVIGKDKNINVGVYLTKEPNGEWKLIEMNK